MSNGLRFLLIHILLICFLVQTVLDDPKLSSNMWQRTSKTGLQRAAARYDGIGKIGGGYGFLVSMVSRCPCGWGGWGGRGGWLALDG